MRSDEPFQSLIPLKRTTRFAFDADGHALSTVNRAGNEKPTARYGTLVGRQIQTTDGAGTQFPVRL